MAARSLKKTLDSKGATLTDFVKATGLNKDTVYQFNRGAKQKASTKTRVRLALQAFLESWNPYPATLRNAAVGE